MGPHVENFGKCRQACGAPLSRERFKKGQEVVRACVCSTSLINLLCFTHTLVPWASNFSLSHTHTHTCKHKYTHKHVHICTHTDTNTCTQKLAQDTDTHNTWTHLAHTDTQVYTQTLCMHTHKHKRIHTDTCTRHRHIYMHSCTQTQGHKHAHRDTHIDTHINTHTCAAPALGSSGSPACRKPKLWPQQSRRSRSETITLGPRSGFASPRPVFERPGIGWGQRGQLGCFLFKLLPPAL